LAEVNNVVVLTLVVDIVGCEVGEVVRIEATNIEGLVVEVKVDELTVVEARNIEGLVVEVDVDELTVVEGIEGFVDDDEVVTLGFRDEESLAVVVDVDKLVRVEVVESFVVVVKVAEVIVVENLVVEFCATTSSVINYNKTFH